MACCHAMGEDSLMSKVTLNIDEHGHATLTSYGTTIDNGYTFECDGCYERHPWTELHEVMAPQWSTGEMVAVLWHGECEQGKNMGGIKHERRDK